MRGHPSQTCRGTSVPSRKTEDGRAPAGGRASGRAARWRGEAVCWSRTRGLQVYGAGGQGGGARAWSITELRERGWSAALPGPLRPPARRTESRPRPGCADRSAPSWGARPAGLFPGPVVKAQPPPAAPASREDPPVRRARGVSSPPWAASGCLPLTLSPRGAGSVPAPQVVGPEVAAAWGQGPQCPHFTEEPAAAAPGIRVGRGPLRNRGWRCAEGAPRASRRCPRRCPAFVPGTSTASPSGIAAERLPGPGPSLGRALSRQAPRAVSEGVRREKHALPVSEAAVGRWAGASGGRSAGLGSAAPWCLATLRWGRPGGRWPPQLRRGSSCPPSGGEGGGSLRTQAQPVPAPGMGRWGDSQGEGEGMPRPGRVFR